jgi:hypothetical protein
VTGNSLLACDPRERRTFQVPRSKPPPLAVVVDSENMEDVMKGKEPAFDGARLRAVDPRRRADGVLTR